MNNAHRTCQIISYLDEGYLHDKIRTDESQTYKVHIKTENEFFSRENGVVYRNGEMYARTIDKTTSNEISKKLIRSNHPKVLYDTSNLEIFDK